jgi:predicted PilT family ATPase
VMDLDKIQSAGWWVSAIFSFAAKYLQILVEKHTWVAADIKVLSEHEIDLCVDEYDKWAIIGKWWENIMALEKKLWLSINVKSKNGDDASQDFLGDEVLGKPKYRATRADRRPKRRK